MIPSETHWFAKLSLAWDMHEPDEEVIDRQRPLWVDHLVLMAVARNPPKPKTLREMLLNADGTPIQ